MKIYRFAIEEKPSKVYTAPNLTEIRRELVIKEHWALEDGEILTQISETFLKLLQNDGFPLPVTCAAVYTTMCSFLQQVLGIPNPALFFDRLRNPYTVEGIAAEAQKAAAEKPVTGPPAGSEAAESEEQGFTRFCDHVNQRGSFARKIYAEFMESLGEE